MSGQRTGEVFITDFNLGVVETLGAVLAEGTGTAPGRGDVPMYVVKDIPGIKAPPDFPGVPVYFAFPDDVLDVKILPSFVVRLDSYVPAMSRWQLGIFEYRVPAKGANPVAVTNPITGDVMAEGFDKYESKDQAEPFDLIYTIQIRARYRNNLDAAGYKMLKYVMRKFQTYTTIYVKDSLGDTRSYDAFLESHAISDLKKSTAEREAGFNLTLRVEGEIDVNDPFITQAMTSPLGFRGTIKDS